MFRIFYEVTSNNLQNFKHRGRQIRKSKGRRSLIFKKWSDLCITRPFLVSLDYPLKKIFQNCYINACDHRVKFTHLVPAPVQHKHSVRVGIRPMNALTLWHLNPKWTNCSSTPKKPVNPTKKSRSGLLAATLWLFVIKFTPDFATVRSPNFSSPVFPFIVHLMSIQK